MIRTVMNYKGGVAKTLTAVQLAIGCAKAGKRTLLIDGDPQGGATKLIFCENKLISIEDSENTTSKVMTDPSAIKETIWKTGIENLSIIPANGDLEFVLHDLMFKSPVAYPYILKKALKLIDYDEVIMDNAPSFNAFCINTVICADEIIIPTNIEYNSLNMVKRTLNSINDVIDSIDIIKPADVRILLTKYTRTKVDRDMAEQIETRFKGMLFKTVIRAQDKPVKESGFLHEPLIDDYRSNVASDYRAFINEVIGGTIQ